jgi:ribosome-binding factor A
MVSENRAARIGQRIKEELSELLLFEVTDPRLEGVFVTDVRVDRELALANVFVSALEGASRSQEILAAFEHAVGFLRRQLSQRVQLRTFPNLSFNWDPSPEHAERIDSLIEAWKKESREDT